MSEWDWVETGLEGVARTVRYAADCRYFAQEKLKEFEYDRAFTELTSMNAEYAWALVLFLKWLKDPA